MRRNRRERRRVPQVVVDLARVLGQTEQARVTRAQAFLGAYGPLDTSAEGGTSRYVRNRSAELRHALALFRLLQLIDDGKSSALAELRKAKGGPGASANKAALVQWAQREIVKTIGPMERSLAPIEGHASRFALIAPEGPLAQSKAIVADWIVRSERVGICWNPECRTPFFVADERMWYCSRPCRIKGQTLGLRPAANGQRKRRTT